MSDINSDKTVQANTWWGEAAAVPFRIHSTGRHLRAVLTASLLVLLMAVGLGSGRLYAQEAAAAVPATVNINTADAQALAAGLKGVGSSRAEAIVRYRESYGQFSSAEELTEVKGIGPSTLEMNRQSITLE